MSVPGGETPSQSWPAGWYPDPLHRFSYRYFNGQRWTADVAEAGARFVDPMGTAAGAAAPMRHAANPPRAQRPPTGKAIASMVLAIAGAAIGWLPVFFVAGFVCVVLAVVFGVLGLRTAARHAGAGKGFAITGLAVAPVAAAASLAGLFFTIVLFDRIDEYLEEGPHHAEVTGCAPGAFGTVDVAGSIENLSDRDRGYVVRVLVHRRGTDNVLAAGDVQIDDLAPGATAPWSIRLPAGTTDVACEIAEVTGPFPFGIDPD